MKKQAKLGYIATNESLDSIIVGMMLDRRDKVLAILGSGDQAFAMLEYGCSVIAVDCNAKQRRLAETRVEMLAGGDTHGFLYYAGCEENLVDDSDMMHRDARNEYFMRAGKLGKIRRNLSNLKIRKEDIFNVREKGFTKIYLSNALVLYGTCIGRDDYWNKCLKAMVRLLEPEGLLYISNSHCIDDILAYSRKEEKTLRLEKELTKKCRQFDTGEWTPGVYRKI
ncbi:MAG: hypothetical protein V1734_00105 [Nanoarchaeota archaeon]